MEFGLLGSLLIRDETGTHLVGAAKQRILLAALLLRPNQVIAVDALAETLWDGRPPRSATTSVRNYVMRLRKALGPAGKRISSRPGGYLAEVGEGELDLLRFEQLRAKGTRALHEGAVDLAAGLLGDAVALWRGPALADVPSDTLHRDEYPRLAESRLGALELKLEAEIRLGRYGPAIAELRGLTGSHPERERLWVQLMTALYRSGRQSEALAAYRRIRQILADEIGAEPGPELRELHRRILTADPVLEWPSMDSGREVGLGSGPRPGQGLGLGGCRWLCGSPAPGWPHGRAGRCATWPNGWPPGTDNWTNW